jgi:hypothetical protein
MNSGDTATLPIGTIALSRPNSLLVGPDKEPINFSHQHLVNAPEEVEKLIEHIKLVAEQFLYHWKTFPLSEC